MSRHRLDHGAGTVDLGDGGPPVYVGDLDAGAPSPLAASVAPDAVVPRCPLCLLPLADDGHEDCMLDALRTAASLYAEATIAATGAYYAAPPSGPEHARALDVLVLRRLAAERVAVVWAIMASEWASEATTLERELARLEDPRCVDVAWLSLVAGDLRARLAGEMRRELPEPP